MSLQEKINSNGQTSTSQLPFHACLKGQWLATTWTKAVSAFKCRKAFMILRQNKYFFLSELFLESMNSDYIAEHRCLLTKPTTITAMSKNQQKKKTTHTNVFQRHLLTKQTQSTQAPAEKPNRTSWFTISQQVVLGPPDSTLAFESN